MELIAWLPEVALAPDQAPVPAQLDALLEDHVSCVEPPCATVVGAALSEIVGAGVGVGVGAGGDPATSCPPPPLLSLPPPQAARLNAHINASDAPKRAVILDCRLLFSGRTKATFMLVPTIVKISSGTAVGQSCLARPVFSQDWAT